MNTKFSDFDRSYNFGKVFGEKALEIIANLSKKEGDGKMAPEMRPMKPWPKEERNKILKGILALHYLSDEHRLEWRQWFDSLAEVSMTCVFTKHESMNFRNLVSSKTQRNFCGQSLSC